MAIRCLWAVDTGKAVAYTNGAELTEVWKNKNLSTQMNAAVKIGDHLHGFVATAWREQLRCVSWEDRRSGLNTPPGSAT